MRIKTNSRDERATMDMFFAFPGIFNTLISNIIFTDLGRSRYLSTE